MFNNNIGLTFYDRPHIKSSSPSVGHSLSFPACLIHVLLWFWLYSPSLAMSITQHIIRLTLNQTSATNQLSCVMYWIPAHAHFRFIAGFPISMARVFHRLPASGLNLAWSISKGMSPCRQTSCQEQEAKFYTALHAQNHSLWPIRCKGMLFFVSVPGYVRNLLSLAHGKGEWTCMQLRIACHWNTMGNEARGNENLPSKP